MSLDLEHLSDAAFERVRKLVYNECGIALSPGKKLMLETRLKKRARANSQVSLSAYCDYLFSLEGQRAELRHCIDAVTTNKTDFFREPGHFDYLVRTVLPELARTCGAGFRQPLLVWSSACSTGEEPYTLAIVLSEFASAQERSYRFAIEATDISTVVLEQARTGVYHERIADPVPDDLRRKYFLRSKDRTSGLVRVAPELRALVSFRRQNLMESDYGFDRPTDVVFCRNVMIYFDRPTQATLLRRISRTLRPGGFLIMGHAESLSGLDLPLTQVSPTVYRNRT